MTNIALGSYQRSLVSFEICQMMASLPCLWKYSDIAVMYNNSLLSKGWVVKSRPLPSQRWSSRMSFQVTVFITEVRQSVKSNIHCKHLTNCLLFWLNTSEHFPWGHNDCALYQNIISSSCQFISPAWISYPFSMIAGGITGQVTIPCQRHMMILNLPTVYAYWGYN